MYRLFTLGLLLSIATIANAQVKVNEANKATDTSRYKIDSVTCSFLVDSIPVVVYTKFKVDHNGQMNTISFDSINCFDCTKEKIRHFKNESLKILNKLPDQEPQHARKSKMKSKSTYYLLPIRFDLN